MIEKTEKEIMQNWKGDINNPLVSIICTSYNHEKYISEAIDSFLMQETNFPFEIIIHDDTSIDNTVKIISDYKEKFPTLIKCILQKVNQYSINPHLPFKNLIFESKGKYIAICEGDDYWTEKEKLQLQIDEMKKYPDVNICFHPAYEFNNGQRGKKLANHSNKNKIFTTSEVILGKGGFIPTNSLVIKKKVVDSLPNWFYKDAPVGDYYLQIFGSINFGAVYINRIMSIYRRNVVSSWSDRQKNIKNIERHFRKTEYCLESLNKQLDSKFSSEIKIIKKYYIYNLAIFYLKNKHFGNLDFFLSKYKFKELNFKCKLLYILNFLINIKLRIKK